jgi:hypothetical protein
MVLTLAALASLALSSWSVASASIKPYKFQGHLSDVLSPLELRPLSPPALTYIPPIGLGTWLSKGEDVLFLASRRNTYTTNCEYRQQTLSNGL